MSARSWSTERDGEEGGGEERGEEKKKERGHHTRRKLPGDITPAPQDGGTLKNKDAKMDF